MENFSSKRGRIEGLQVYCEEVRTPPFQNTSRTVKEFLAGAEKAGADIENIFLIKKNIKHCLGYFDGWINIKTFKKAGREVVTNLKITEETMTKLVNSIANMFSKEV